ncbi:MAG TPA: hypothetical protein VI728_03140 [Syntrophales bacterium]|nr:hypothetical protein [Syntrophales bacterium]
MNGPKSYPFLTSREGLQEFLVSNKIYVSTFRDGVLKRVEKEIGRKWWRQFLFFPLYSSHFPINYGTGLAGHLINAQSLRGLLCGVEAAEDEECGSDKAQSRPEEIHGQPLLHVEYAKDGKDAHRDDFLDHLELWERIELAPHPIGGHLKTVLHERHEPAEKDDEGKGFGAEILEMPVPGICHEGV